jgi:excisionase family DNA binding protein
MGPFYTLEDVCSMLKISRSTIKKMMGIGRLRYIRISRKYIFPQEFIDEFIKNSTIENFNS